MTGFRVCYIDPPRSVCARRLSGADRPRREPDVWPEGDSAVRKTLGRFVNDADSAALAEAASLFAPHRSYLALYMWRIVERMPS